MPTRWRTRAHTFPLQERVLIMGVLNVTPDSFSDGGRYLGVEVAVARAVEIEAEGADLLDLGGESSRPGSQPVPLDVELARVLPVLAALAGRVRIPISVDTTKAEVARRALDAGAAIINDVSALRNDPDMADVVAKAQAGLVLMHMQGTPATMQHHPAYTAVVEEVCDFLRLRVEAAVAAGIEVERIAVDPGFGFGKTSDHNLALLGGLQTLRVLDRPIVIGPSRKSFVGGILGCPAIYATSAKRVTDEMFIEAAHALADQVTPAQLQQGLLYPPQSDILQTEIKVAARVAQTIRDQIPLYVNR